MQFRQYFTDGHGDVTALANENGYICQSYAYDAFGNLTSGSTTGANRFLYASEYYDTELGTYYLRMRYYEPRTGVFLTEDPARDGLNWYSYCAANPVNYVDPWGLMLIVDNIDENSLRYRDEILRLLSELTGSEVDCCYDEENDYTVFYFTKGSNSQYPLSSELLTEIFNHDKICSLRYKRVKMKKGEYYWYNHTDFKNKNDATAILINDVYYKAKGSDSTIFFNPLDDQSGTSIDFTGIMYIALGHELIHALNIMEGIRKDFLREEELTIGLNNDLAYLSKYSENLIRKEHGIAPRLEK